MPPSSSRLYFFKRADLGKIPCEASLLKRYENDYFTKSIRTGIRYIKISRLFEVLEARHRSNENVRRLFAKTSQIIIYYHTHNEITVKHCLATNIVVEGNPLCECKVCIHVNVLNRTDDWLTEIKFVNLTKLN